MSRPFPRAQDDAERLQFLASLSILDTGPDENIDRVTRVCRRLYGAPISVVTLVAAERQWFKSIQGLDLCETSRDLAFCNYTILGDEIFEVVDAAVDPRFADHPSVVGDPFIRYYAGAPLIYDGRRLGSLCIVDSVARDPLTLAEREALVELAELVVREIRVQRVFREAMAALASSATPLLPD